MFAAPEKLFCMHFEIGIKDREPGVRLTLTNMEKEYTVSGGNVSLIKIVDIEDSLSSSSKKSLDYPLY